MIHQHEAHRCCVSGFLGLAAWGSYLPERREQGIWWACSDHRSEARARRDRARGTSPKAPGAPEPAQDSLFGERE